MNQQLTVLAALLTAIVLLPSCAKSPSVALPAPSVPEVGVVEGYVSTDCPPVAQMLRLQFGGQIELVGINVPDTVERGEAFTIEQVWRCLDRLDRNWVMALHVDCRQPFWRLNRDHDPPVPTSYWEPGQYIRWELEVILPPSAPAGEYSVHIGPYVVVPGTQPKQLDNLPVTAHRTDTGAGRFRLVGG